MMMEHSRKYNISQAIQIIILLCSPFISLVIGCKQKGEPEIIIHENKLYEFLYYSGYYKPKDVVVSFKNQDEFHYEIDGKIVKELTIQDIFQNKYEEEIEIEKQNKDFKVKPKYYNSDVLISKISDRSDVKAIHFGRGDYEIKVYPTKIIPYEFQYKKKNVYLFEDLEGYKAINYAIFRSVERLSVIEKNPIRDYIKEIDEKDANTKLYKYFKEKAFINFPDKSTNLINLDEALQKLPLALKQASHIVEKNITQNGNDYKLEYPLKFADEMMEDKQSALCMDNSVFFSAFLNNFFEAYPLLFFIKEKDYFHVFFGIAIGPHSKGQKVSVLLYESNAGQTIDTINKITAIKFFNDESIKSVKLNTSIDPKCDGANEWKPECQFIGEIEITIPETGYLEKSLGLNSKGLITFYEILKDGFIQIEEEERIEASYRQATVILDKNNPFTYERKDFLVLDKFEDPFNTQYTTIGSDVQLLDYDKENMDYDGNPVSNNNDTLTLNFLKKKNKKNPFYSFYWHAKVLVKRQPVYKDFHAIKTGNSLFKQVDLLVDARNTNYSFDKFNACVFFLGYNKGVKKYDLETREKCLNKECSKQFNCKNLEEKDIQVLDNINSPKFFKAHYRGLRKNEYLFVMYTLKPN